MTNVRKHAPHASVAVTLRCSAGGCELAVVDTGGSVEVPDDGYGLIGMRERAELLGGELSAGPCETGFRVLPRVPA
jgi:signal transduction histidine kinase